MEALLGFTEENLRLFLQFLGLDYTFLHCVCIVACLTRFLDHICDLCQVLDLPLDLIRAGYLTLAECVL